MVTVPAKSSLTIPDIILRLLALAACCLHLSCDRKEPTVTTKDELIGYLDTLEQRYEGACREIGLANWNSYAKEAPYDLDGAKASLSEIFLDTTAWYTIEEWRAKSGSLADDLLARRLELWRRSFLGGMIYSYPDIAKLENDLQQRITNFTLTIDGAPVTRAKINNLLRREKRQNNRKRLWSVTSLLSALTYDDLIRLIKMRNEKAVSLGFPHYYALALHLQAIDEGWLLGTLRSLEEHTRGPYEKALSVFTKKLRVKTIGPWDFDFALRESASLPDKYFPSNTVFDVIHRFQSDIGFHVDSLPIREVVRDIPYGGLSLAIHIPTDSRFLVNPTEGKGFFGVAFHEYGHSLKAVHTNVAYPILKGYEWIPGAQCAAYEEGVADLHAEFTDDSLWLALFTKAKPRELKRYVEARGIPALFRLRRLLKDFFIEYELYRNPGQDPVILERTMYKKYLLVDLEEDHQHQSGSSIWYTSYPCYFQNYILAAMIATQLQEALTDKFGDGKVKNPATARWIIDHLYAGGETLEWTDRIRNATGKSLETGAYLRKMGIVPSRYGTHD